MTRCIQGRGEDAVERETSNLHRGPSVVFFNLPSLECALCGATTMQIKEIGVLQNEMQSCFSFSLPLAGHVQAHNVEYPQGGGL